VSSPEKYQVVIAGGGPAGAAAALYLARAGHRVLLADSADPASFKIGESLPPAARTLLRDLDVWEHFQREGHLPCPGNLAAWGCSYLHSTDHLFDPHGHGWHLDRGRFDRFLRTSARTAGAEVREQTVIRRHQRGPDATWRLTLTDHYGPVEIQCEWVIDATGRRSAIARGHGARRQLRDALMGLFVCLEPAPATDANHDRDARTLVEAAPDGWWYTALVPGGRRVLAYLTDADLVAPSLRTLTGFRALLNQTRHVRNCLTTHGYVLGTKPCGAPASSTRLAPPIGGRWLAVGDAAISFDPLSSQGVLTALVTGIAAGQALHAHLAGDQDALTTYRARLAAIDTAYQQNRTMFYRLERRWLHRPFWRRRIDDQASGSNGAGQSNL
jgi:2-polyprenyl-6-methoxyphenol hydroxylase-like FAD-dependent oxidoreductase